MPTSDPYSIDAPAPPPPGDSGESAGSGRSGGRTKAPVLQRFDAELDVSEVDERLRPGAVWTVRGREIGRSRLIFMSRRMCYPGRLIIAAVHLIDDRPVPLFGKALTCEYEADGLYKVELELIPIPDCDTLAAWVAARTK